MDTINRVLINHESANAVALSAGLGSSGMLHNWIRKYKKNGYNVIEKKRGRTAMTKPKNKNLEDLSPEQKIK